MSTVKTNKGENFTPTLISDFFDNAKFFGKNWIEKEFGPSLPAVNIKENKNEFELDIIAPGFKKNDFKLHVDNNTINISAEKEEEKSEENKKYTRKEYSFSSFSRAFTLPESVDPEKIDAKYEDGILKLIVSKKAGSKMLPNREIKIA